MEEEEGNGAGTRPLEPRRHALLAAAVREGDTPAAAVSIHMDFQGSSEKFLQPAPPRSDGGARSSAGCAEAAFCNLLTSQSIMGLTFVGEAGAAAQSAVNTAAAGAARGGRDAESRSKGKHSDNAFRLDPGHCHHLSNPNVLIAYDKWATNQLESTGKKVPYWAFFDELKTTVVKYPPVLKVYLSMCVYDVTHAYLSPNKNEIY